MSTTAPEGPGQVAVSANPGGAMRVLAPAALRLPAGTGDDHAAAADASGAALEAQQPQRWEQCREWRRSGLEMACRRLVLSKLLLPSVGAPAAGAASAHVLDTNLNADILGSVACFVQARACIHVAVRCRPLSAREKAHQCARVVAAGTPLPWGPTVTVRPASGAGSGRGRGEEPKGRGEEEDVTRTMSPSASAPPRREEELLRIPVRAAKVPVLPTRAAKVPVFPTRAAKVPVFPGARPPLAMLHLAGGAAAGGSMGSKPRVVTFARDDCKDDGSKPKAATIRDFDEVEGELEERRALSKEIKNAQARNKTQREFDRLDAKAKAEAAKEAEKEAANKAKKKKKKNKQQAAAAPAKAKEVEKPTSQ